MKLRSHGDGASSSKGKEKINYRENSDSEDDEEAPSDVGNIDSHSARDSDGVPKRRKTESYAKAGSQSSKNAEEEESEDADLEIVARILVDFAGDIAEESGGKQKGREEKHRPTLLWQELEQENNRWIEEHSRTDFDQVNQNEILITVEPSDDLIIPLLRYQKEWLAWALGQEESSARGGILADEMGMGKTLQAIALVLFKRRISTGSSSRESSQIKGTLVICPVVAVKQWAREIDRFTSKGSTKVFVYHGPDRGKLFYQLSDYDFVITTYGVVETEYRKYVMTPKEECGRCGKFLHVHKLKAHLRSCYWPRAVKPIVEVHRKNVSGLKKVENDNSIESSDATGRTSSEGKHILHCSVWERIVLDEAHCIKARYGITTRAVLALQSRYKWALSGTPLQNHVDELYSIIRFLQIVPFSYYCCRDCDCNTLDHSSAECPGCGHKNARHFCWWRKYVSKPILNRRGNPVACEGALILLKHKILKSLMLRRTKEGRAADLVLPSRIVTLKKYSLNADEEDYYTALYNDTQVQFDTYVDAGTLMNNYMHILALLTRLRQALDHPYLVEYSPASMERKGKAVEFTTNNDGKKQKSKTTILNTIQLKGVQDFETSTKIEALMEEIRFMVERDGSAKAIVFSQFLPFLDLIHYALQKSGVNCAHLDGSKAMEARDTAIKKFTEDPSCRVILMSLKAGGVALNLTVASHVFFMDPWWNPAMERQAQDRIHRIGQYKPIRIVKFIIENTIEEKVLKLQEQKELLIDGVLDGSSEALEKLTTDDLIYLFAP